MNDQELSDAFGYLRNLWAKGEVCSELPHGLRPATHRDAYRIQALVERQSSATLAAWKIAATSLAGQKHIGVSGPLVGRYIAEQMVAPGGRIPFGNNRMRVAEVEFAFRLGEDIVPRQSLITEDDVVARMASLHPSIEIPDSRYLQFEKVGELHLIADNACAHWLCIGPAMPEVWRDTDLAAFKPVGRVTGKPDVFGLGSNVLGSPRLAMTWFVNEMSGLGITLKRGQFVTTGTCVVPMSIVAGDHVEGDFGALGQVDVHLV